MGINSRLKVIIITKLNPGDQGKQRNFQPPGSSCSRKGHVAMATGALTVTIIKKYIILGELLKGKSTFHGGDDDILGSRERNEPEEPGK